MIEWDMSLLFDALLGRNIMNVYHMSLLFNALLGRNIMEVYHGSILFGIFHVTPV